MNFIFCYYYFETNKKNLNKNDFKKMIEDSLKW